MVAGMRAVSGAPYPADVARTQPLTIEQLDRLDVAAAQAQLEQLIRTSPIEVAVVGDLPKERALELVAQYLGSLPTRERVGAGTVRGFAKAGPARRTAHGRSDALRSETPQSFVYAGLLWPGSDQCARHARHDASPR